MANNFNTVLTVTDSNFNFFGNDSTGTYVDNTVFADDNGDFVGGTTGYNKDFGKFTGQLYGMALRLGVQGKRGGANPIWKSDLALSGTWDTTSGSTALVGTGGSANTQLSVGDYITVNGVLNYVSAIGGANSITVYRAIPTTNSGLTIYKAKTLSERLDLIEASSPSGYISTRIENTSSTQITVYKGSTVEIQGIVYKLSANDAFTASGASQWYYILATPDGTSFTVSSLAVDAGHITANTQVYFPNASSTYSDTYNGHYSSNDRIIGAYFWDGSAIKEVIKYKEGRFNPFFLAWNGTSSLSLTGYYNYTGGYSRLWGDALTASNPSSEYQLECNETIVLDIVVNSAVSLNGSNQIRLNGSIISVIGGQSFSSTSVSTCGGQQLIAIKGDIIKFYFNRIDGSSEISNLTVKGDF